MASRKGQMMKWVKFDSYGNEQVWYSDDEVEKLKAENERLKSCLQEIKKIAERQLLVTNVRTYQMVYYADFSEYRNEILQKITEAESEG